MALRFELHVDVFQSTASDSALIAVVGKCLLD